RRACRSDSLTPLVGLAGLSAGACAMSPSTEKPRDDVAALLLPRLQHYRVHLQARDTVDVGRVCRFESRDLGLELQIVRLELLNLALTAFALACESAFDQ